ncbi:MAG: AAA family ATPase [Candidatus Omnitrophica bacterium]|nr:AAA family ATPase [Candidatus Omnitrophota bacterium]
MSYTIAVCGKGGSGKTTFSGLLIRQLLEKQKGDSIIAIDADPNANLDEALGVSADNSIVALIDDIAKNPDKVPKGMTKNRYLEYHVQDAVVEGEGFDLLAMGRPEGPGCYCYANNLLRALIDKLGKAYSYMVIDNEAGMEHLSRRTTRKIDLLFVVSEYTVIGLRSAKRILDLTRELEISVKEARLVVNKAPQGVDKLRTEIDKMGMPFAGAIPQDEDVFNLSLDSANVMSLSQDSKAFQAVSRIYEEVSCLLNK